MQLVVLDTWSGVRAEVDFKLTIDCKVKEISNQATLLFAQTSYSYTIGESAISFNVPSFAEQPAGCYKAPKLSLINSAIDGQTTPTTQ
jgi:hypothetical protein